MSLPFRAQSARPYLLALGLSLAAVLAHAQSFDGDWLASYTSGGGNDREAEVSITGSQGTWKVRPRPRKDKNDPCVGRPFPVAVTPGAAGELALRVDAAGTVAGCDDRRISLKAVDAKTLEGQFSNGTAVRLVRP